MNLDRKEIQRKFLSTPSARRATPDSLLLFSFAMYFYPRPPRGGRPEVNEHRPHSSQISIHALREEGDLDPSQSLRGVRISIHALREEGDLEHSVGGHIQEISIHALREEGDSKNRDKISIFKQIIQHSARI